MRGGLRLGMLALACAAGSARAESAYVVDQLVVVVAGTPEADAEKVGQVKSGDRVEILERQDEQTHIKLSNGRDGWVKSSYLTADPPTQARLADKTAESDRWKQTAGELKQENDRLRQDVSRLQSDVAAARAAPVPVPAPTTATESTPAATAEASREGGLLGRTGQPGWPAWTLPVGVTAVLTLVAGFVIGWKTLDHRIRRKYGGLRIY